MGLSVSENQRGLDRNRGSVIYGDWRHRDCAAAGEGEVLLSPEVRERVWRMVEVEQRTIPTKHEGSFLACHVTRIKSVASPKLDETPQ